MTPDLDLKAAREAVARYYDKRNVRIANAYRSGVHDKDLDVQFALSAIRIRREMEAANG